MSAPTPNPNALALILEECAFCHTPARDQQLHFCSGCRSRKYCNEECQTAAWAAGHKKECKKLKTLKSKSSKPATASAPRAASGAEGGGGGSGSDPAEAKTTKKKAEKSYEKITNGPAASTSEPNTSDTTNIAPAPTTLPDEDDDAPKGKKKTGVKTLWVTIFKCFNCGKHGKKEDFIKCSTCEEAYYCDSHCERAHAKSHAHICVATVAAKTRDARRQRLARDIDEKGRDKVEGAEENDLCVICQSTPVDPIEVRL